MTKPTDIQEMAITKGLDVILRILLAEQRFLQESSKSEQLLTLHSSGLTPSEIAPIVGLAASDVASKLSKLRKRTIRRSELASHYKSPSLYCLGTNLRHS
jgi:hypothetical protein